MKKILIISPCYNVEDFLEEHIANLSNFAGVADILFINDGSTDKTEELIQKSGFYYIQSYKNNGKASALRQGFDFAIRNNYDAVITIDSDLQHDYKSIYDFIGYFKNAKSDYIVGAREFKRSLMPFSRIISNRLTSFLLSLLVKSNLNDSQCGLRLISSNYLALPIRSSGFQFESEHLIRSIWAGARISFIKTKTIYNKSKSSMKHVYDTIKFIKLYFSLVYEKIFKR